VVTRCESDDGRQWTDGADYYSYDGSIWGDERARSRHDLVEYIGMYPPPKPPSDKTFEIERLQRELQQAEMDRIAEANALRVEQAAEIERLQAELKAVQADAHRQLRRLQESHEKLTARLQAEQAGQREAFRIAISMILEKLNA
jgi:molecular chaperone GrpE (heat shock protein)